MATVAEYRREFQRALDKRINEKALIIRDKSHERYKALNRGRKHRGLYQIALYRDRRRYMEMTMDRVRVYQFETPEMTKRYGHLLARQDD